MLDMVVVVVVWRWDGGRDGFDARDQIDTARLLEGVSLRLAWTRVDGAVEASLACWRIGLVGPKKVEIWRNSTP